MATLWTMHFIQLSGQTNLHSQAVIEQFAEAGPQKAWTQSRPAFPETPGKFRLPTEIN